MTPAVIVIDMLDDFVTGALANPRSERIIPQIAHLLDQARERGWPVVYANDAHLPGDFEERVWGPHALAGSPGAGHRRARAAGRRPRVAQALLLVLLRDGPRRVPAPERR